MWGFSNKFPQPIFGNHHFFPPRSEIVWPSAPRLTTVELPEDDFLSPIYDGEVSGSLPIPFEDGPVQGLQLELNPNVAQSSTRQPAAVAAAHNDLENDGRGISPLSAPHRLLAMDDQQAAMTIRREDDRIIITSIERYMMAGDLERALVQWRREVDAWDPAGGNSTEFAQLWERWGIPHELWVSVEIRFWVPYADEDNARMPQD